MIKKLESYLDKQSSEVSALIIFAIIGLLFNIGFGGILFILHLCK